eukprot:439732_1
MPYLPTFPLFIPPFLPLSHAYKPVNALLCISSSIHSRNFVLLSNIAPLSPRDTVLFLLLAHLSMLSIVAHFLCSSQIAFSCRYCDPMRLHLVFWVSWHLCTLVLMSFWTFFCHETALSKAECFLKLNELEMN